MVNINYDYRHKTRRHNELVEYSKASRNAKKKYRKYVKNLEKL